MLVKAIQPVVILPLAPNAGMIRVEQLRVVIPDGTVDIRKLTRRQLSLVAAEIIMQSWPRVMLWELCAHGPLAFAVEARQHLSAQGYVFQQNDYLRIYGRIKHCILQRLA